FAGLNVSSRTIGGDLFDFVELSKDEIGVAIGDVAGKGIPGALLMALLFATFREQVRQSDLTEKIIFKVNETLYHQTQADKFATFFYGILDCGRDEFRYTNAGHNPPLFLDTGGGMKELVYGGPILGFITDTAYASEKLSLRSGDILLMYTDGLSEALNDRDEEYGEHRILAELEKNRKRPAAGIIKKLLKAIETFTKKRNQDDDITMVVIKKL
ncbi:PP2C family protein-serine/threonine phosphatase, partial [candidate division KSB1 bacterium]